MNKLTKNISKFAETLAHLDKRLSSNEQVMEKMQNVIGIYEGVVSKKK
jgi:hypothetical protein